MDHLGQVLYPKVFQAPPYHHGVGRHQQPLLSSFFTGSQAVTSEHRVQIAYGNFVGRLVPERRRRRDNRFRHEQGVTALRHSNKLPARGYGCCVPKSQSTSQGSTPAASAAVK